MTKSGVSRRDTLVIGLLLVLMFLAGMSYDDYTWRQSRKAVDYFHRFYVSETNRDLVFNSTRWLGTTVLKLPSDLWVFQEILVETRPDVLIETGTHKGGSALYYATVMDAMGEGRVLTVDIADMPKPTHPRIEFLKGSSTSPATIDWLRQRLQPDMRVMVTLDSLHDKEHVLKELDQYAPLVSPGCYLVVEDTALNGHPIRVGDSPTPGHEGPWEALDEWLPNHPEFQPDKSREKFMMTASPGGWLKRVR